jgi:hypothetical protein
MVNNEKLPRAKQFVTDDKRTNGIIAGPSARIPDNMRVTF